MQQQCPQKTVVAAPRASMSLVYLTLMNTRIHDNDPKVSADAVQGAGVVEGDLRPTIDDGVLRDGTRVDNAPISMRRVSNGLIPLLLKAAHHLLDLALLKATTSRHAQIDSHRLARKTCLRSLQAGDKLALGRTFNRVSLGLEDDDAIESDGNATAAADRRQGRDPDLSIGNAGILPRLDHAPTDTLAVKKCALPVVVIR